MGNGSHAMTTHITVSSLTVTAPDNTGGEITIVDDVSFSVARGGVLALIGESGSGKTTIALALMGYARGGCRISGGSVQLGDTEVLELSRAGLRDLRGRRVSYVAQSAAAAFNPSRTIMNQVTEAALIHGVASRAEAEKRAVELFRELALPNPDTIGARYPHQVSGGQLQRLMAAMALITNPELVIFDEPTTALDVTTQIDVLRAFKRVIRERGMTAIYVSHDLAVVAQMADQIVVLNQGQVRESGETEQILNAPADAYTQSLMAAARPAPFQVDVPVQQVPLLEVSGLVAGYGKVDSQGMPAKTILKNIDLRIDRGATLGVIGESGSGKSTLARAIAGLLPPAKGRVSLDGESLPATLNGRSREQFRRIQIVFQNADTALNPAHTVGRVLGRPLQFYHGLRSSALKARVAELLDLVKLPADLATRRCGELSGGQKQRINLARALAAEPDLILCDEVTSALDTVVGAAILELMAELRERLGVSYLFISHDISTVRAICDDVVVLYDGCKVEEGSKDNFRAPPFHPYTGLLIASVPELERGWLERAGVTQAPPLIAADTGDASLCRFLDRCPVRIDGLCNKVAPPRISLPDGNEVLCHHSAAELQQEYADQYDDA
jgi:peptide/nickel transport system ATP-binding protein